MLSPHLYTFCLINIRAPKISFRQKTPTYTDINNIYKSLKKSKLSMTSQIYFMVDDNVMRKLCFNISINGFSGVVQNQLFKPNLIIYLFREHDTQ